MAGLALVAAACGDGRSASGAGPAPSVSPGTVRRGPTIATTVRSAVFSVDCKFSHRASDDPIVHFGQPGASHLHEFFGATGTDAFSAAASLRGGATTCDNPGDTAAYWVPALLDGSTPITATLLRAYYRAAVGADVSKVKAPPAGIQLIAGDAFTPVGRWTPTSQVGWGCGLNPRHYHRRPPPDCTVNAPLTLRLVFPDCWDGRRLGSGSRQAHVARSSNGRCPPSHPVPILQVQVSVQYPVWRPTPGSPSPRAKQLVWAAGGWQTTHGDLLNSWAQADLERLTAECVRAMANCTVD